MTNSIAVKNVVEVEFDFSCDVVLAGEKSNIFQEIKLTDFYNRSVSFNFSKEMVCSNRDLFEKVKRSQVAGGLLTPSYLTKLVEEADGFFNRHCFAY